MTTTERTAGEETTAPVTAAERIGPTRTWRAAVWATRAVVLLVAIGGWQLLAADRGWGLLFGSPLEVARTVGSWLGEADFWQDVLITVEETVAGYALGMAAALVLIAVVLPVPAVGRFLSPFIAVANALPKIALAPLFIVWFGISFQSKVYFVAVAMFFIVFYGVYSGLKAIDRTLVHNFGLMGAGRYELVRDVYAPAVATWLMSSLRISVAWALTAAVISEYIASNEGLGNRIARAQQALDPDAVVAGIVVIAVVSLLADRSLHRVEERFRAWRLA